MNLIELLTPPGQNSEKLKDMRKESQRRLKENYINIMLANAALDAQSRQNQNHIN